MSKPLCLIKLLVPVILILILILPCLSCPPHHKQSLLHFKSSLLNIYNTSNSSYFGLESWNSISDCCTWNRVVCSLHSREITALHLDGLPTPDYYVAVNSRILDPLYGIRSLELLDISFNGMHGKISGKGLANLTKLVHLDMRWNYFEGSIPGKLFHLRFLQSLDLSENILMGELSSEIGKLVNLRTLKLDMNSLDGDIPVQIGNLTKLQQFSISNNEFSGRDSRHNSEFEGLDFRNNILQMQIPIEIGSLSNISTLSLSHNRLTGAVPRSIRHLSKLETLHLDDNILSGEIPSGLFDIKSLKYLYIGGNNIIWNNGVKIVPGCMLSQLSLKSCKIFGDIPEWISTQKNLDILELSHNQLKGKFPLWLAEMQVGSVLISDNMLSGSIPPHLFSKNLSILDLSRNNFSGELPGTLGDAKMMTILMLSQNNFSGSIPESIVDITQLSTLDLSRNRFSGNTFPIFNPHGFLFYVISLQMNYRVKFQRHLLN